MAAPVKPVTSTAIPASRSRAPRLDVRGEALDEPFAVMTMRVLRRFPVKHKCAALSNCQISPNCRGLKAMKHNSYFEGKVQSLGLTTPEGPATVGVIEPGQYNFKTDSEERMHIIAGKLKARLAGSAWRAYSAGESFVVPAEAAFDCEAAADVAYLCYYKK